MGGDEFAQRRSTICSRCTLANKMILRLVRNGKIKDSTVVVWIVLRELPDGDGYIIFYDDDRDQFGLASNGFPDDRHPVICGYYGDFWNTFKGM